MSKESQVRSSLAILAHCLSDPKLYTDYWADRLARHSGLRREAFNVHHHGAATGVLGLATGASGIAVMFTAAHRLGLSGDWDRVAHEYLSVAIGALTFADNTRASLGVGNGLGGLLLALSYAAEGERYQKVIHTLGTQFIRRIGEQVARVRSDEAIGVDQFDYISGLVGQVPFLLSTCESLKPSQECLIAILDALSDRVERGIGSIAGYFTPMELLASHSHRLDFPDGCVDAGIAHGLAGVICAFAFSIQAGFDRPRYRYCLAELTNWLLSTAVTNDQSELIFPTGFADDDAGASSSTKLQPMQAWCYGNLSGALALLRAEPVLQVAELSDSVRRAVQATIPYTRQNSGTRPLSLCHGYAGLTVLYRVLTSVAPMKTQTSALLSASSFSLNETLSAISESLRFGFGEREVADGVVTLDPNPTLLTGAAGVGLALVSALGYTSWERLLLIR